MSITATRRPIRELDPCAYQCRRCGGIRSTKPGRPRPMLCRDCQAVQVLDEALAQLADPVRDAFEDDRVTAHAALLLAKESCAVKARVTTLLLQQLQALGPDAPVDLVRLCRRAKSQLRAAA